MWWSGGDGGDIDTGTDSDDFSLPDSQRTQTREVAKLGLLPSTCVLVFDVVYGLIIQYHGTRVVDFGFVVYTMVFVLNTRVIASTHVRTRV